MKLQQKNSFQYKVLKLEGSLYPRGAYNRMCFIVFGLMGSLRKHPFLHALPRRGRKSEEKRVFSQAS